MGYIVGLIPYFPLIAGFGLSLQHFPGHRELVDLEGVRALQQVDPDQGLRVLRQHLARLHHRTHHLPERRLSLAGTRYFYR